MQRALDRGLSSILLVPEIGLTPQMAGLLDAAFGERWRCCTPRSRPRSAASSGGASVAAKRPSWSARARRSLRPRRTWASSCVDEEHDQSYKQEETPRYNARDVAVMRAKLAGAVVGAGLGHAVA